MNGIASALDNPASNFVENLWKDLETHCGLSGYKSALFPHFSWQVTESYDQNKLREIVSEIARLSKPFIIRTTGVGLFSGETPIIFIPIVKDDFLVRFHAKLWEKLGGIAYELSDFYSPDKWIPHITLAYNDVNQSNLNCAMQMLAFTEINLEIHVDNLVIVDQKVDELISTISYRFQQ
jgi:2'-5' RNA ligase